MDSHEQRTSDAMPIRFVGIQWEAPSKAHKVRHAVTTKKIGRDAP
jgi:hypothetical protein